MGTVRVPEIIPSPAQDCHQLRTAFQGYFPDGKAVIQILGHRNAKQRKEIGETYQQLFNESLIDCLHQRLSTHFRDAAILWTYDSAEREARLAKSVMESKMKDMKKLQVVVEIACASNPKHLMSVRKAYCSLFNSSLEQDIASSVSHPFLRKLLVGLVSSYRYDKEEVNSVEAKTEALRLHVAMKSKQLEDDDVFCILSTRSFFQLRHTFACYTLFSGNTLQQDIEKCGDGDLEYLLNVTVRCIECPQKHFAKVVRDSIIGVGTDEESLNRAIINRVEIDMLKIKEEYASMYGTSVDDAVAGDTSGDYREFLMTLLGKESDAS